MTQVAININLEDVTDKLRITEKWELLQALWDSLRKDANKSDWQEFFKDNDVCKFVLAYSDEGKDLKEDYLHV